MGPSRYLPRSASGAQPRQLRRADTLGYCSSEADLASPYWKNPAPTSGPRTCRTRRCRTRSLRPATGWRGSTDHSEGSSFGGAATRRAGVPTGPPGLSGARKRRISCGRAPGASGRQRWIRVVDLRPASGSQPLLVAVIRRWSDVLAPSTAAGGNFREKVPRRWGSDDVGHNCRAVGERGQR